MLAIIGRTILGKMKVSCLSSGSKTHRRKRKLSMLLLAVKGLYNFNYITIVLASLTMISYML